MIAIIRPIKKTDLDGFEQLVNTSSLGITSLPKTRNLLEKKIDSSINAFSKHVSTPTNEQYIFVLEENGKIGGTCMILAESSSDHPSYFYQLKTYKSIPVLKAKAYSKAPSELAGLYLDKNFQKTGLGKLLSLSRLLFIAAFKERFQATFFANIRGVITENDFVPFWEGIGRHFLDVDYSAFLKLRESDPSFLQEIMPKYPIYLKLLPKEVQDAVGKPHEKSAAALNMLQSQGFKFANEVDMFDGGPRIIAKTSKIKTIRKSQVATVEAISHEKVFAEKTLLANENIDFRACFGELLVKSKTSVVLNQETAHALQVKQGGIIRYV